MSIVLIVLIASFISAATITDELHLNIQTTNSSGSVVTGTFNFTFNISTSSDCANVIYTNFTNLTTDSRGIISYYLENVNLNFSEQYWLCYYRNGTLINASKIARTPYTFTAKNISAEGVKNDSNLNLRGYNITASTGFFSWIGSLTSRIAELFIQNISFIGNINGTGNITTTGRIGIGTEYPSQSLDVRGQGNFSGTIYINNATDISTIGTSASYWNRSGTNVFLKYPGDSIGIGTDSPTHKLNVLGAINVTDLSYLDDVDFNGGWLSGGVSITGGSIYVQTGYFYNITGLEINTLRINGSMLPASTFDNTFDIGNGTLRWRDLYLGRNANISGNLTVFQRIGIGTATPSQTLDVRGQGNFSGTIYINNATDITSFVAASNSPWNRTAGNTFLNYPGDNVGIGTASPAHGLDVKGTGATTGLNVIRAGYSAAITNDFTTTGVSYPRSLGLGIMSGNSYAADIPVSQPAWYGGYGGYIGLWSDVNGGVESSTNVVGVASVPRGTGSGSAFGFYTNLSNAGVGYTKWGVYSTGEDKNYFSGNVGIGTSSPTGTLSVNSSNALGSLRVYNTTGSEHLFINGSSGNVGIGNSTPPTKLYVLGGNIRHDYSTTANQKYGFIESTDDFYMMENAYYDGAFKSIEIDRAAIIQTYEEGDMAFRVSVDNSVAAADEALTLNPLFVINMSGQVGIGTSSPTGTLSINSSNALGSLRVYNTTGSEHLFVNGSSGNVGIGTTAPGYKLDVAAHAIAAGVTGGVRIGGTSDQYSGRLISSITTPGGVPYFEVRGPKDANGWLAFNTGSSETERMRIDSNGNVGIGTTSPDNRLHVFIETPISAYDVIQYPLKIEAKDTAGDFWDRQGAGIQFENTASSGAFISAEIIGRITSNAGTDGEILFRTRDANSLGDRVIIKDDGRVGIGATVLPTGVSLVLNTTAGTGEGGEIQLSGQGTNLAKMIDNKDGDLRILNGTNAGSTSELMRIKSNGNVGIGTTTPGNNLAGTTWDVTGKALDVYEGTNSAHLIAQGTAGGAVLDLIDLGGAANDKWLQLTVDGGIAQFRTINDAAGLQADNILVMDIGNGNVGIGTGSPGAKLHISGGDLAVGSSATVGKIIFGAATENDYILSTDAGGDGYKFYLDGTSQFEILRGVKVIIPTGNVGIGTADPLSKLSVGGSGVSNTAIYGKGVTGVYGESTGAGASWNFGGYFYVPSSAATDYGVYSFAYDYDFYAAGPGTDYGTSSSIRWKKNITQINDALEKILKIRGVYFNWDKEHDGEHDMGFIAEEVGEFVPEIVEYETDISNSSNWYIDNKGNKKLYTTGVDYGAITPLLVEAIKEQQNIIEQLKAENQAQQSQISSLQLENTQIKTELCLKDKSYSWCK